MKIRLDKNNKPVMVKKPGTDNEVPETYESIIWVPIDIQSRTKHGSKIRTVIAETMVFLYDESEWRKVMVKREDNPDAPFPVDVLNPVSVGKALCSDKDQYSRKIGLSIATDRALKRYTDSTFQGLI